MSATRFIVVRHCEAQGNIRRVFNGITDGDITENGARQLDLLAARMAEEHFDVIYSSPLRTFPNAILERVPCGMTSPTPLP